MELKHICKVEGHASLKIRMRNGKVDRCGLEVVEGSRFFEKMVIGKHAENTADIISRICGICSSSHHLTAIAAIEDAMNISISEQTKKLRELILMAEWIRSHTTHLYFLALPDYLGCDSAIEIARKQPEKIDIALSMIELANTALSILNGREIHPITPKLGGFRVAPSKREIKKLAKIFNEILALAVKTTKLFGKLKYPAFSRNTTYVALKQHAENYTPRFNAHIISSNGTLIHPKQYHKHFKEGTSTYSNARFVVFNGKEYMTGALARINNNFDALSEKAREVVDKSGIQFPSSNPFHNNFAQAIEMIQVAEEAGKMLASLEIKKEESEFEIKAGRGIAVSEAPRGILFHEYEVGEDGKIKHARIITPTAQNLRNMEEDIKKLLPTLLKKSSENKIKLELERLIRSYDPCFSCAAHFLRMEWMKDTKNK